MAVPTPPTATVQGTVGVPKEYDSYEVQILKQEAMIEWNDAQSEIRRLKIAELKQKIEERKKSRDREDPPGARPQPWRKPMKRAAQKQKSAMRTQRRR
jgi:hypothetical protein